MIGQRGCHGHRVDSYCVGNIHISDHVTISLDVILSALTHKHNFPLLLKPITIAAAPCVSAGSFIGPGSIVGKCAVAVRDIVPWTVVTGNPSVAIGTSSNFVAEGGATKKGDIQ